MENVALVGAVALILHYTLQNTQHNNTTLENTLNLCKYHGMVASIGQKTKTHPDVRASYFTTVPEYNDK